MNFKLLRGYIKEYFMIFAGSLFYAAGFQIFLYRNDIITGGVTGIAMIINLISHLPVGILVIIMNIPLFIMARMSFGRRSTIASLICMTVSSLMIDAIALYSIDLGNVDMMVSSIYGGLLMGIGLGVVYLTGATTGGVDIMAKFLRSKWQHINLGTIILILDIVVIVVFAISFKKVESALYALIAMFINATVVDVVLYGLKSSKACYIISEKSDTIKQRLLDELDRGVTVLHGEGGYTGERKDILLCTINKRQISQVRSIIKQEDSAAFVMVSDVRDVFGDGFEDIHSNK
ncbi:MAG: YitT family protein [Candidatus Scatomorpha sp.]|jgi:uncharacterized membrane-anchored protein YitT (DUF2179 family)